MTAAATLVPWVTVLRPVPARSLRAQRAQAATWAASSAARSRRRSDQDGVEYAFLFTSNMMRFS